MLLFHKGNLLFTKFSIDYLIVCVWWILQSWQLSHVDTQTARMFAMLKSHLGHLLLPHAHHRTHRRTTNAFSPQLFPAIVSLQDSAYLSFTLAICHRQVRLVPHRQTRKVRHHHQHSTRDTRTLSAIRSNSWVSSRILFSSSLAVISFSSPRRLTYNVVRARSRVEQRLTLSSTGALHIRLNMKCKIERH